jgi:hypothetical protein
MIDHNCYINESTTEKCPRYSAELGHYDTDYIFESNIILQIGLPKSEVQIYINELESPRKYELEAEVQT